jgi:hypothetical protein
LTGASEPGDSVTLQHVLKAWGGDLVKATTHPTLEMLAMFTKPAKIGEKQVLAAKKAQPDLVCAIDFPFWFAYGYVEGEEGPARRALLQQGLALLQQLTCPVLVGDLPDMQGAARRMLAPAQIPSPALLQELNQLLAAFVAEHKNVRLVPLAALVATMKDQGVVLPLAGGALQTAPGALLQGDRLHANRLGMAFLGLQLQSHLQAALGAAHPLGKQSWALEQFIAACGAEGDLELVRAAKAGAAAGK